MTKVQPGGCAPDNAESVPNTATPRKPRADRQGSRLPRLLTVDEAAEALRTSDRSIRRLVSAGRIRAYRPTHERGRMLISETELCRLLEETLE